MIFPNFVGGSNVTRSLNVDQERTVNLILETSDSPGASARKALYLRHGVSSVVNGTPPVGAGRAHAFVDGREFMVLGGVLYEMTAGGVLTTRGIGPRSYTVVDYTALALDTATITANGTATVLTEGTNWTAATSNAATATSLASAINALAGVGATAAGAVVTVTADSSTSTLTIASGDAINLTIVQGANSAAVAIDANPATISTNGDGGGEMFITSGGNGYNYTLATNVMTAISALAGKATMGDMIDGYFLAFDANTSTWYISDLLDGATWDPTNFVQRSSQGDPWVAMKVSGSYIYLLGQLTSEVWYDAGSFPIPFAKHSSGNMSYGCAAPFSPEIAGGSIVWLGRTVNGQGAVLRTNGFSPEVISTYAMQVALSGYASLADAIGDTFEDLGHTFYILTFPAGNGTWVWDEKERVWCEWLTWIAESAQFNAWRPMYHAFCFNEHRILDRETGEVYLLSSSTYTDVDDLTGTARPIRWMRRAPALVFENRMLYYPAFCPDIEPGVGLSGSGQGSDPQVMLRMSDDGGHVWGNEIQRAVGKIGQYGTRVEFLRCGAARRRVFELTGSDPVPWRILGAYLPDFEQMNRGVSQQRQVA